MIRLYTYSYDKDHEKYERGYEDLFIYTVLGQSLDKLDNLDKEILKGIDNVTLIDGGSAIGKANVPFRLNKVSRGCKIVLVIKWMIEHKDRIKTKNGLKFNITSCGDNTLKYLVKVIGNEDVSLLTCNYALSDNIPADIIVNDKYKLKCFDELADLGGALYES
jgi:hypothetical protein